MFALCSGCVVMDVVAMMYFVCTLHLYIHTYGIYICIYIYMYNIICIHDICTCVLFWLFVWSISYVFLVSYQC
jgi:hypothetical protein